MVKTVKLGDREITLFTFVEYCQAYRYVRKGDCNVRTYIKYIVAKLIAEKIIEVSPLELYIVYKLLEKGKTSISPLELLKDIVLNMFRKRRHYNGVVTPSTVEKVVKEIQREIMQNGKEEVLKRYLPEKWF